MTRLWFLNMTYNSYPIQDEQGTMVAKLLPTEARLRDGRPKFRNAKQNKKVRLHKKGKRKGKERKKSYSGHLLTASVGRQ